MTEQQQGDTQPKTLALGRRVNLRDRVVGDADTYMHWWRTQGQWRQYDAPWEDAHAPLNAKQLANIKKKFINACYPPLPVPRKQAMITTPNDQPLGWVSCYINAHFPKVWLVGIDICEDDYLNQGLGTEALALWLHYLFKHSEIHRIGLNTWSFNHRMMRVAEKLGFLYEGCRRELIEWQGERLDLVYYGILKREWEEIAPKFIPTSV